MDNIKRLWVHNLKYTRLSKRFPPDLMGRPLRWREIPLCCIVFWASIVQAKCNVPASVAIIGNKITQKDIAWGCKVARELGCSVD